MLPRYRVISISNTLQVSFSRSRRRGAMYSIAAHTRIHLSERRLEAALAQGRLKKHWDMDLDGGRFVAGKRAPCLLGGSVTSDSNSNGFPRFGLQESA